METIVDQIASEIGVTPHQVEAAVQLLADGATVPFIARYRKEATSGMTAVQLRMLEDRLHALRELEERRAAILQSVDEQGRLTPEVHQALASAMTRARLEDLFLPHRPKRRTRLAGAREAGLDSLAQALVTNRDLNPEEEAAKYVDSGKGVPDVTAALDGARWILIERVVEDVDLLTRLHEWMWGHAQIQSRVVPGKQEKGAKFSELFAAVEPVRSVPSHRALAMLRGRKEGILRLSIVLGAADGTRSDDQPAAGPGVAAGAEQKEPPRAPQPSEPERLMAERFGVTGEGRPADGWLVDAARRAWRMKVLPYLQVELERRLRDEAEREAIRAFGRNLHDLLLSAPAGSRVTMGLDPGLRTGVKAAVVDAAGRLLATATVFPHQPRNEWEPAIEVLADLARQHVVELVSIGNGTGSRETDRLISDLMKRHPDVRLHKVVVSEAGASAYAASKLASRELPDIDVSLRSAVSIARRLQDPLAEFVKIEPRSIGVGQYQHDVNQAHLGRALGGVVEDCVSAIGVDVNTASAARLARVAGLNRRLADTLVAVRETNGPFRDRQALRQVPGLSDKAFEQAAGFLRITDGSNPLDASAIHPEAYSVVDRICELTGKPVGELVGQAEILARLVPAELTTGGFGEPAIRDILAELEWPGRDPRPPFRIATFAEGVEEIEHVKPGMVLEGVVTNVATFGAFVDIGVHQDGLVHVSRLADRFVKDPREVVKAGDIVKVKVIEVDLERRRIALTMRFGEIRAARAAGPKPRPEGVRAGAPAKPKGRPPKRPAPAVSAVPRLPAVQTAMSAAFSRLLKRM